MTSGNPATLSPVTPAFPDGRWRQLSDRLIVTSSRRETICRSDADPAFHIWCAVWKEADGTVKLACTEVTGDPAVWPPSYNFNNPGVKSVRKIFASKDGGRSWQYTGNSWNPLDPRWTSNSDPGHMHMVRLKDNRLMRTMRCYDSTLRRKSSHPVYDPEKARKPVTFPFTYQEQDDFVCHRGFAVSGDEGKTWEKLVCIESRTPVILTGFHRLKNDLLVAVGALLEGNLPYGLKAVIVDSADDGKTWSEPQIFAVNSDLVRGVCEESDFVELDDGSLLVISRVVGSDGRNIQSRLKRNPSGQWEVLEQTAPGNFIRTGYPAMCRAQDGTIFHDRGTSLLYSCDDGRNWEPLFLGCTYYGKLVETSPRHMLSISQNNIGDSAYPWRHDAGITQCAFSYRRYRRWGQDGATGTARITRTPVGDCHLALALEMSDSCSIVLGGDPENGYFARLVSRKMENSRSLFFEMGKLVNGKPDVRRIWCVAPAAPEGKFEMQLDRQCGVLKAAVKLNEGSWASRQEPPFYLAMNIEDDFRGELYCRLEGKGELSDIRFAPAGGIFIRDNWQNPEEKSSSIELDAGRTF